MNTPLQNLITLHSSPIILCQSLPVFLKQFHDKEQGLLAAYLFLPFVAGKDTNQYLMNYRSNMTLRTFTKDKVRHASVLARVYEYKQLTNKCIITANTLGIINLGKDLKYSVDLGKNRLKTLDVPAANLAKLLVPHSIKEIFSILGVHEL